MQHHYLNQLIIIDYIHFLMYRYMPTETFSTISQRALNFHVLHDLPIYLGF